MADKPAESKINNEQPVSLGEQLRRAREEKQLTIEDVAADLKVKKGVIISLEAENWQDLYAKTYARGHFINYVKYLGLPLSVLIAAFNLAYPSDEKELRHNAVLPVEGNRKKILNSLLMAGSAVLVVIVLYMSVIGDDTATASSVETEQNRNLMQEPSS